MINRVFCYNLDKLWPNYLINHGVLKKLLYSLNLTLGLLLLLPTVSAVSRFKQDYTPQDPNLVYQTYFDLINIKPSWSNDLQVNKEVVVAILDSGVDLDHPDLVNNIWLNAGEIADNGIDDDRNSYIDDVVGWDFVDSDNVPEPDVSGEYDIVSINHGTVVAGILAGTANDSGIVGIAPHAKIMPLRILDEFGQGNTLVLSQAIDYAVENGADIINLSLVGKSYDNTIKQAIKEAYEAGVVVVAASGNEENKGLNLNVTPRYPVCELDEINRVLGVSAVDNQKKLATFANHGSNCIDLSAPGANFYSTLFQKTGDSKLTAYYGTGWSGTSVAAPIISGTASLLKMHYPNLRPYNIYNILSQSSQSLKTANPDNYAALGSGLIDIGAALNLAAQLEDELKYLVIAPDSGQIPQIIVLDQEGNELDNFLAYAEKFKGGVNIAIGDVNNDDLMEIITAPKAGGGPHLKVFSLAGELLSEWFAYDAKFSGGVNIAIGDIDGDGQNEIITAPESKGGPHLKIFNWQGQVKNQFFVYEGNYYGGVNLALGDVNNDGKDEIITAPAAGRISEVKVFDWRNRLYSQFVAYDNFDQGVEVSVGDVNNDGWQEIVTAPSRNLATQIRLFSYKGKLKHDWLAFNANYKGGVELVVRDLSGDGIPEILTLPHKGSAALLRIYNYDGVEKNSFYLRDSNDKNGYQLEVAS